MLCVTKWAKVMHKTYYITLKKKVGTGEMAQEKGTGNSSRGPEFKSQHPHGGPRDLTPSSGVQMYMQTKHP